MEKEQTPPQAVKNSDFESLLIARRSTRQFTDAPLSQEEVQTLLQAALLAPTSKNSKSYEFIAVENKTTLQQLSTSRESGAAFLEKCALAVVVMGDQTKTDAWIEDASIAAICMQLQAESLGLGSCWCQIRNRFIGDTSSEQYICDLLDIPEHFGVLCIIGFGRKNQERKPNDLSKLTWEKIHIERFTNGTEA